jgi:HAMP domain-containing protein
MLTKLRDAVATVRILVSSLETDGMPADDVAQLVHHFAELERLALAGRTLAGRRVERSKVWREQGFSTPARWMAATAQTTVSDAITTIETGRRLDELPEVRRAVQAGELSAVQAAEISAAAAADPAAERGLLETARTSTVARLRDRCREVVAAANDDPDVDERIHRSRYLRSWSDVDGAFRLDARLTPDSGARLIATVKARARVLLEQARKAGSKESPDAYAADGLVSLADEGTPGPRAVVHVHVDKSAWNRGRVERAERCFIPGVGPVPVAAARRLARDGIVKAVLADEADIRAVAHFGRTIPAKIRTALEARDVTCVVPDCDERDDLEIDHILPMGDGGETSLGNLARLCRWHHSLKTHRGWRLAGSPGAWKWFKPKRNPLGPSSN